MDERRTKQSCSTAEKSKRTQLETNCWKADAVATYIKTGYEI